jgi:hypothetical protein
MQLLEQPLYADLAVLIALKVIVKELLQQG